MKPRQETDGTIYVDLPIIDTARHCHQHVIDAINVFATPQRGIPCEFGHPVARAGESPIKRLNRIGQINLENACAMIQGIRVIRPAGPDYLPILKGYVRPFGRRGREAVEGLFREEFYLGMRALVSPERELLKIVTWDVVPCHWKEVARSLSTEQSLQELSYIPGTIQPG